MQWFEGIILGLIQGVTEFLPISSSGHVWLAEHLLFRQPVDMSFIVFMHLASLLAVLIFLRKELIHLVQSFYRVPHDSFFNRTLALQLIWATLITTLCGLLLKDFVSHQMNQTILLISLFCTSAMVIISSLGRVRLEECSWIMMSSLGLIQGLAALPGISRSGVTVGLLLLWGLPKKKAVDISFLLSIPVIMGSVLLFLPELNATTINTPIHTIVLSFVAAFTATYAVIRLLRKSLEKIWIFCGIWCFILAAGLMLY